jgi:hypothetical protein
MQQAAFKLINFTPAASSSVKKARLAQPTSSESFLRGRIMLTSTPRWAAVQIACSRSSLGTK